MSDDFCGFDYFGTDDEIGDAVVTIPSAGATYTDAKTVTAVQSALVKKGYDLGSSGPNNDGVDGVFGSKTKAAIKKVQGVIGEDQNGQIDTGIIMALQVTPGVLPPGVTMAGRAAVQAQVALDAATAAEHASTPSDVQTAAQSTVDAVNAAAPPAPPAVKQAAQDALTKAKAAKTPDQVKAAAQDVQAAAKDVHAAVAPSWWKTPAWTGGLERWKVAAIASGGIVGLGALAAVVLGGGAAAVVPASVIAATAPAHRVVRRTVHHMFHGGGR